MEFESNIGERENVQCRWASLRYGDKEIFLRLLFFLDSVVRESWQVQKRR